MDFLLRHYLLCLLKCFPNEDMDNRSRKSFLKQAPSAPQPLTPSPPKTHTNTCTLFLYHVGGLPLTCCSKFKLIRLTLRKNPNPNLWDLYMLNKTLIPLFYNK